MNKAQRHPAPEKLQAFGLGKLRLSELADIESHVADCRACARMVRDVPDDTLTLLVRRTGGPLAAPPATEALQPGQTPLPRKHTHEIPPALLDHPRYQILEFLGAGGMGAVYKARHRLMDRVVALKVISASLTGNPQSLERFRREVKAAARLDHPNIVTAYDAEQAGDVHFLVMEFIEGESLAQYCQKDGRLPVPQACELIRQAALGLQHAHERGMIHRDIKPQNLMLTPEKQLKILDFGLARLAMEQGAGSNLTQTGAIMGTPDYVSPEQASDAKRVDIRSDIYSLGCTLYFLLTGRLPFPDGSTMQKLLAHVERAPQPVTALRAEVPAELGKVIERMMAKKPARRFQTPAEVAMALATFAGGTGLTPDSSKTVASHSPVAPPKASRTPRTAAIVAMVAVLACLCAWLATKGIQRREDRISGTGESAGQIGPAVMPAQRVAPDLSRRKPLFSYDFHKSNTGFSKGKGQFDEHGFADGRYFIRVAGGRSVFFNTPAPPLSDFACLLVARVTGPPSNGWGLCLHAYEKSRGVKISLTSEAELLIGPSPFEAAPPRAQKIGPIANPAIKAGAEFNKLMVVLKNREVSVWVNSVPVGDPFTLDGDFIPATLALGAFPRKEGTMVEFAEMTIWALREEP